jgi:hypothetical protein
MAEVERVHPELPPEPPRATVVPGVPSDPGASPKNLVQLSWEVLGDGNRTSNLIKIIRAVILPVLICVALIAVIVVDVVGGRMVIASAGTGMAALISGVIIWIIKRVRGPAGGGETDGTPTTKN